MPAVPAVPAVPGVVTVIQAYFNMVLYIHLETACVIHQRWENYLGI